MSETENTNGHHGDNDPVPTDDESANPFERAGDAVEVTEPTEEGEPVHHVAGGDIGDGAD